MKVDKAVLGAFREMVSHMLPGGIGGEDEPSMFRAWGLLENGVHVTQDSASAYIASSDIAYQRSCKSGYDFAEFQKRVVEEFFDTVGTGEQLSDDQVRAFLRKLDAEETISYFVMRDLRGVRLPSGLSEPLKLGPFTILHYPTHKHLFLSDESDRSLIRGNDVEYFIGVDVVAKTSGRAQEKADRLFEVFERLIRFMIGPTKHYEVKVLGTYGRYGQNVYLIPEGGAIRAHYSWHGAFSSVRIDDGYFRSSENGHEFLWSAVSDAGCTHLQKRLLKAAQWLGDSYSERDPAGAFIKAAIALEALFTFNDKSIISPSIMSSISETVACLLGQDARKRLMIEKKVKDHYRTRSAVAHAGKDDVSQGDVDEFSWLVRMAIAKILGTPALRGMDSIEHINEHVKSLKYSFPSI